MCPVSPFHTLLRSHECTDCDPAVVTSEEPVSVKCPWVGVRDWASVWLFEGKEVT